MSSFLVILFHYPCSLLKYLYIVLYVLIYYSFAMKKLKKDINRPNLYDYLKIIALLTMFIDHLWYYVFPEYSFLRVIGRISFPIFLFLVWFSWSYSWRWDIPIIGIILWAFSYYIWTSYWFWSIEANILIWITIARFFINIINKKHWARIFIFSTLFFIIHPILNKYVDYWSFSFFFVLWWRIAKYHSKYFYFWIVPLILLIVNSIYTFDFWFKQWDFRYLYIIIILFTSFFFGALSLSKENINMQTQKKRRDSFILWFSKHSLAFYWTHIVVLCLIWLFKFHLF